MKPAKTISARCQPGPIRVLVEDLYRLGLLERPSLVELSRVSGVMVSQLCQYNRGNQGIDMSRLPAIAARINEAAREAHKLHPLGRLNAYDARRKDVGTGLAVETLFAYLIGVIEPAEREAESAVS